MRHVIASAAGILVFAAILMAVLIYTIPAGEQTPLHGKAAGRVIMVLAAGVAFLVYVVAEALLSHLPSEPVEPQPTYSPPIAITPMPIADPLAGKMDPTRCPECGKTLRSVQQHLLRQHDLHGVFVHPMGDRSHWVVRP